MKSATRKPETKALSQSVGRALQRAAKVARRNRQRLQHAHLHLGKSKVVAKKP